MTAFVFGCLAGLLTGATLTWLLVAKGRERRMSVALEAAIDRLAGGPPSAPAERGLPGAMGRLNRAVEEALAVLDEAADLQSTLERALDAIPQGVVIADETGGLVFQNEVASAFAGARHADALVQAAVDELVAEAMAGRGGNRVLDLFGPPRRTLAIEAVPLPSMRGIGALAVIEDISERRRLEAVRRDFVANISHELKTPVGALGLLAETLLSEEDPAVRQRLAERIQTEALRVGRTIEDLLELSRIESSELPHRHPVPVHLVLAEAVERIRPAAEQAGIGIHVEEPSHRLAVLGDRRQLVSALYNLLDNAVKYSDRGSTVEVWAGTDGIDVEIAVRDHGIGIPAGDLERVFERFYRVDHARSRQTGGTGLGLAIVRHVVNNHAGSVHVESRLGEGSTFTLRLPTASGPVALDPPRDGADDRAEVG
ncbi:sensor histidine kinase [Rhabdothermincola sediminis]|uniref:sensor histidine kinase n=1 Tax=Rhabdothermincola sediminis TaxID=2751370 RepID=UPI001AA0AADD|nr:ATP-binding protein [Rhabdothermincola sediminis]